MPLPEPFKLWQITRSVYFHGLPWPCVHRALRGHLDMISYRGPQGQFPYIYQPTYLSTYLLIYPPIYVPEGRILYPFICPSTTSYCFYFGKMGKRIRTNSTKLTLPTGMGLRRRLCYAIFMGGRFYLSRRFLLPLYIWGELTSIPPQSTHFRILTERRKQFCLD